MTGSGVKTQSSKISDVEALITNYTSALEDYAENPDATSSPSIAQTSLIDFPDSASSIMDGEGDQIYVYIDGNKVTQDYVNTTASTDFIAEVTASGYTVTDLDGDGSVGSQGDYDILASRVATYKALADEISDITGLNAYTVDSLNNASTAFSDVINGVIKIDSLIPGEEFILGDVYEVSGSTEVEGTSSNVSDAVAGTGEGAVESAMEALKDAVAGTQYDVYEEDDVASDDDGVAITFATGDTISFTIGTDTVTSDNTLTSYDDAVADLITKINTDANLSLLVEAKDINGRLVIESKNTGEEFSGVLEFTDADATTTYSKEKNLELSGNSGAGAEFMQIISSVDQESSRSSLQLKLDSLGLTDSSFGEFAVDESGLITISQDGVDYVVGQIAVAQFSNNIELESVGDNLLAETTQSGGPIYSINNENSTTIEAETLELSTADLSESLVNLMVFQRAFEANSKSITTADDLLTTLIQLKN